MKHLDEVKSVADLPPWDRVEPIEFFKWRRAKELKYLRNRESSLLKAVDQEGSPLYKLNDSGNLVRTKPMSPRVRRLVIERDGSCVQCGAGKPFEVDHIIRYIDGGSNEPENLQTLCVPCHRRKGGR